MGALNRPGRAIKGRQCAISGVLNNAASEALDLAKDSGVLRVEKLFPLPVTQTCQVFGGSDDVGEHDRGKYPIRTRSMANTGQELLDLLDDSVGVTKPRPMVLSCADRK